MVADFDQGQGRRSWLGAVPLGDALLEECITFGGRIRMETEGSEVGFAQPTAVEKAFAALSQFLTERLQRHEVATEKCLGNGGNELGTLLFAIQRGLGKNRFIRGKQDEVFRLLQFQ